MSLSQKKNRSSLRKKLEHEICASDLGPVDQEEPPEQEVGDGRDEEHHRLDEQELAVVGRQRDRVGFNRPWL